MANHTGTWNAAGIAPDTGPAPGAAPILDLPADGETADAASVNQAFQTLGNHMAWQARPTGKASEWELPVKSFRSARGHRLFEADHFGMPGGHVVRSVDEFTASVQASSDTGGEYRPIQTDAYEPGIVGAVLGWQYYLKKAGILTGFINTLNPSEVSSEFGSRVLPYGRCIELIVRNSGVNDRTCIRRLPAFAYDPKTLGSLEWSVFNPTGIGSSYMLMGLADITAGTAAGVAMGAVNGCYFRSDPGVSANWQAIVHGGGGAAPPVDTGVSVLSSDGKRFQVVFVGADVDDASTTRALFFIDGELVANVASSTPTTHAPAVPFFGIQQIGSSAAHLGVVAPVTLTHITALAT